MLGKTRAKKKKGENENDHTIFHPLLYLALIHPSSIPSTPTHRLSLAAVLKNEEQAHKFQVFLEGEYAAETLHFYRAACNFESPENNKVHIVDKTKHTCPLSFWLYHTNRWTLANVWSVHEKSLRNSSWKRRLTRFGCLSYCVFLNSLSPQVNLNADIRTKIRLTLREGQAPLTLFAAAKDEVFNMMESGPFQRFKMSNAIAKFTIPHVI